MSEPIDVARIRHLGDMQRLTVKPGDVFVLSSERPISIEQQYRMREWWDECMGRAFNKPPPLLLVLADGLKLTAVNVEQLMREAQG